MNEVDAKSRPPSTRRASKHGFIWLALSMFSLGIVASVAFRYVNYKSDAVHYHANFALYINDQRDEFKSFTFYEEVSACSSDSVDNPKIRVHLHNQNNGLVHVHAHAVTWGQFFENLDYLLGDTLVKNDNGVFIDGQDSNRLTFILNGQKITKITNQLIKSEDRLLINYGEDDTKTIDDRYQTVPKDAHKANTEADPAACSGGVELTNWQRLKQSAGL